MNDLFRHLGLSDWPFSVVPQPVSCDYIADREELRGEVEDLVHGLSRRSTSNIHIFWAWFGAGKTHALYFIRNLALQEHDSFGRLKGLVPVYSEFPRQPGGFLDVYRTFSSALDLDLLADAFLELSTGTDSADFGTRIRSSSMDLFSALQILSTGAEADRVVAERWLRGQRLPVADFRKVGIRAHIGSAEEAIRVFSKLIEILAQARQASGARVGRVIWLLDEFQRVASSRPAVLREINDGLHSTFNSCPSGLTLVLSFSGEPGRDLPSWFSPELRDRIGVTKVLLLPPMNSESALIFVRDVLRRHRHTSNVDADPYFPFTREACQTVIGWIAKQGELKPRSLMQAFDQVLGEADSEVERGRLQLVDREFAERVLAERIAVTDQSQE